MTTADADHAIAQVLDAHEAAYHPGIACPETQEGRCAIARPVESPEDRMRDARTDQATPTTDDQINLTEQRLTPADRAAMNPGRSFRTWMSDTERNQLDARAATAEQERDDALDDRDTARAETANLRRELDKANAGRQKLQSELDTMTQVAQSNKRHVTYLTAVIEAIANVEPHIHNGDATEDNCSPYCPGCRIRTAMNTTIDAPTPGLGSPSPRAQEQPVSSVIAVDSRFAQAANGQPRYARAAGHPAGGDWVRLNTGSGRQYEGYRSQSCPGDGVAGHQHDIRCVEVPS